MIVAIQQPNYLPWGGYFYKLMKADLFIFLDDVQFSKNSFINRTYLISNKKKVWLTAPVTFNLGDKINQVKFVQQDWPHRHLSKIKNSYTNAPFFKENWKSLENLFYSLKNNNMSEVNKKIILTLASWLEIKISYMDSSSFINTNGYKSENRLIQIIKKCKCDTYLSGLGAKKYQDENKFHKEKIKLVYSDFSNIETKYKNYGKIFEKGTSIIDLIFYLGRRNTINYLKGVLN